MTITGKIGVRRMVQAVLITTVLFTWPVVAMTPSRIVAIGDVHGDVDALVSILKETGLVDEGRNWTGGDAVLVQVGDLIDRGLKDSEVLDLYMALEQQSAAAGGQVVVLLGNHEVMNLMGDLRYVSNYAPFADAASEDRRQAAYSEYANWRAHRAEVLGKPAPSLTAEDEQAWMASHYRGFVEREAAFGPEGKYGAWLRDHSTIARFGDYVFVHGGLSPSLADHSLDSLNEEIAGDIDRFDGIKASLVEDGVFLRTSTLQEMLEASRQERDLLQSKSSLTDGERDRLSAVKDLLGHMKWMSWRPDGPTWFRGFNDWKDAKAQDHLTKLRAAYGENVRFVSGHSVMKNKKIHARFDNTVFLIDTGMSAMYYRGKPSALEIKNDGIAAVYRLSGETFIEPTVMDAPQATRPPIAVVPAVNPRIWWDAKGQPLPFRTDAEVMDFMRTADVVSIEDIGEGVTKPKKLLLEKDGIQMNAIYRYVSKTYTAGDIGLQEARDDCIFECAAYALSGVLGINNIPPVISRRIDGKKGTVQIWVEHAMTEKDRRKKGIQPFDPVRWAQDWQMVEMFDNLIYNDDRNTGNIIIDQTFTVWMIDHTRAFRAFSELRESPEKYLKQIEVGVWDRLQTVEDLSIKEALQPFLQSYEIDGLLKRRRNLVTFISGLIDKNGADNVLFKW
ncbi:MAG: hypothetical protein HOH43_13420 [Candidatus Latescibacteria bacterium]|jgi:hypothetical protein|nr:hypothetical protein [Candidatus Latescibacterota bacterium]